MSDKVIIGKEEWCAFPELGLPGIKARIDSGARTSALHAFNIDPFVENGQKYVYFDIHPIKDDRTVMQRCKGLVVDRRHVKSSSGEKEHRHVIRTLIVMGESSWDIELTLTNRDSMGFRMLLGREAMQEHVLIDPNESHCLGKMNEKDLIHQYKATQPKEDGLNIGILASNLEHYSNRRLMEAGEERGHKMHFLNIQQCYMNISASDPNVLYRGGRVLSDLDIIIPRIKPSMTFYGCAVTRQFEALGIYCQNNANAISNSRDKLRSLQLLSSASVPMPASGFANSPVDTSEIIKMVGDAPLVIKVLEGTQGKGVVLAETNKAAESVINAFKSLQANILVQEFIAEANGKDLRCFVVNGKVIGSIQRSAKAGDFRTNLHLGGIASAVKTTPEERRIAINAAKVMGLAVAGVDLIRSKDGPLVLEISASPGLESIEDITEKDMAGLMIDAAVQQAKKRTKPYLSLV